eukprot:m.128569 g.128569  ORF g.128569 m.128569 type:complete len:455 (-) comp9415_c0_seq9:259-1623(-)
MPSERCARDGGHAPAKRHGGVLTLLLGVTLLGCTANAATSIPVLCYHQLNSADNSLVSVTTAQFAQQMDFLVAQGYQTISPDQYVAWLQGNGTTPGLPAKPILITFDDGTLNAGGATPILRARRLNAVMYVVTGYADNPGTWSMNWTQLAALQANGWHIQLHAGPLGHDPVVGGTCQYNYFYGCRKSNETLDEYKARVVRDIDAGIQALASHRLINGSDTFAIPWDYWGQMNGDADVTDWLPSLLVSRFKVVFQQAWGYQAGGYNRRYRFEIHSDTSQAAFEAGLADTRFSLEQPSSSASDGGLFGLSNSLTVLIVFAILLTSALLLVAMVPFISQAHSKLFPSPPKPSTPPDHGQENYQHTPQGHHQGSYQNQPAYDQRDHHMSEYVPDYARPNNQIPSIMQSMHPHPASVIRATRRDSVIYDFASSTHVAMPAQHVLPALPPRAYRSTIIAI